MLVWKRAGFEICIVIQLPCNVYWETQVYRCTHHSHNSIARLFSTGDLDPSMLLMYDTAVVLSGWIWTWVSLAWLQNDLGAINAALSSKMFMWSMASLVFHLPSFHLFVGHHTLPPTHCLKHLFVAESLLWRVNIFTGKWHVWNPPV